MVGFAPVKESRVKTGDSKTRSNCQTLKIGTKLEVSVDWTRVKTKHTCWEDYRQMLDFVADRFSDTFDIRPDEPMSLGRGAKRYPNVAYSVKGMRSGWQENKDGTVDACLEMPGGVLSQVSMPLVWLVYRYIDLRWYEKCTRIDIAVDDYSKRISQQEFFNVINANKGNAVGIEDGDIRISGKLGGRMLWTVYCGSRESEKMLRYYYAQPLHDKDCNRFEGEFKRRMAEEIWKSFVSLPIEEEDLWRMETNKFLAQFLAGIVVGNFDFVDRTTGRRPDRCKRYDFWQTLRDEVECAIKLSPSRPKSSVEKIRQWWNRQIVRVMAVVRKVMGASAFDAWMRKEYREAEQQFTSWHYALIEQATFEKEVGILEGFECG